MTYQRNDTPEPMAQTTPAHRMTDAELQREADFVAGRIARGTATSGDSAAVIELANRLLRAPSKPPTFPTMLRKMWSGAEVQAWINEHWKKQ